MPEWVGLHATDIRMGTAGRDSLKAALNKSALLRRINVLRARQSPMQLIRQE